MKFVYIIRSVSSPKQYYIGITTNLKERIKQHNSGASQHTAKFRPWALLVFLGFSNDTEAEQFEKYLKSGSGREFSRRHFRKD